MFEQDGECSMTKLVTQKPQTEKGEGGVCGTALFLPPHPERKGEGGVRTREHFKKSFPQKPLVSIITVVYNGEHLLEKTIGSVIDQSYDNIEYIIIDGGSTDGTMDVIKKFDDKIDYWVSEPDGGIYDAMNKGLSLCAGEIVGIINADDWYLPGALEASINALTESGKDYSYGAVKKVPSGIVVRPIHPLAKQTVYQGMMYPHVSAFIRREVYEAVGRFNTAYRIAADFDMALRIHLSGYEAVAVDNVLAEVLEGGVSGDTASKREYRMIAVAHGKPVLSAYVSYVKQILKYWVVRFLPAGVTSLMFRLRKSRYRYE